MRPVKITDTTLRDAHQSLWATRMKMGDMLPVLGQIDDVGYWSLEVWGGATFDSCLRFLDENPWDRLRVIKQHAPKTPMQMLLRGQNIVGYRHYSDDIVRRFVLAAARNGIHIFRCFDALNDTRNLEVAIEAVKEAGAHAQGAVVYTISPVHTLDHYVDTAKRLKEMGCDSICIKDMAALLSPYRGQKLVEHIKQETALPVHLHCHYIGGMAPMNYLKAIEAGVDIIDTACAPLAFGNSQPATEMIVAALKDTPYDSGLDLEKLYDIAEYFEEVRSRLGFQRGVTSLTHMKVFSHQVPGGMISNLQSQLAEQKALDRMVDVLEEIPRVRAEVGYPPLVTPLSQIVGTQAVINVLTGKRWAVIPGEMKAYVKGLYGKPPGPMAPEIEERILGGEEPITSRPGELVTETFDQMAEEIGELARTEEDVLSYALFPKETRAYLELHREGAEKAVFMMSEEVNAVKEDGYMDVSQIRELVQLVEASDVNEVVVEEGGVKISVRKGASGAAAAASVQGAGAGQVETPAVAPSAATTEVPDGYKEITAPMVGTFYRSPSPDSPPFVEVGDVVEEGQSLCILEAMKLMNEIGAEEKGIIREILVENAEPVQYGQPLFRYEPAE
ncbi:MAG: acetyl-CoA carboxylase biotin carboxyl carrier protein [Actinobacteria bacterium]|nr:MAG: acetyl-CoA carboxylase biotin carboxyl carrier protein [Actinomycetota bacterium]